MIKISPATEAQSPATGSKTPGKTQDGEPFAQILQSSLLSAVYAPESQSENQAEQPVIDSPGPIAEEEQVQLAAGLIFLSQLTLVQDFLETTDQNLLSATVKGLQLSPVQAQAEPPVLDVQIDNVPALEATSTGYPAEPMPAPAESDPSQLPDHQGIDAVGIDSTPQPHTKPADHRSAVEPIQPDQPAIAGPSLAPAGRDTKAIERIQSPGTSLERPETSGNATRKPNEPFLAAAGVAPDLAQRQIDLPPASPSPDRPAFASQSPTSFDWTPIVEDWPLRPTSGPQQWTVRLRPDEFGQVQIQLERQEQGQGLIARIVADQVQTSELLRSQLMQLDHALQDKGIQCQRLEVLCESAGSGPDFDHQSGRQPDHSGRDGFRDGSPLQPKPAGIASSRDQPAAAANHWSRRTSNRFEHWT